MVQHSNLILHVFQSWNGILNFWVILWKYHIQISSKNDIFEKYRILTLREQRIHSKETNLKFWCFDTWCSKLPWKCPCTFFLVVHVWPEGLLLFTIAHWLGFSWRRKKSIFLVIYFLRLSVYMYKCFLHPLPKHLFFNSLESIEMCNIMRMKVIEFVELRTWTSTCFRETYWCKYL